ncbi:chorismate mutase [Jeotgalicoccus sp. S0W5]|uniref:chorismate mutase n=1 Tax=Jeotgalicoccus sp. S0W5 TaxID=2527874 RepID=UPI001414E1D3|nr:chorismate mutase [Jeotgalicoccus sp. S0W5]
MGRHEELRNEIDRIDRQLMKLFEERMNITREIADYKRANDIPVLDQAREDKVIEKNVTYLKDHTLDKYAREFTKRLMELSRTRQSEALNNKVTKTC